MADQIAICAKRYVENPEEKLLGVVINKTKTAHRQLVKTASVVVAICLIFTFGVLFGNSRLKPREPGSDHNLKSVIPNIKTEPVRSEKLADRVLPEHHAKANIVYDDTFPKAPKKEIDPKTQVIGEQIHESRGKTNTKFDFIV